MQGVGVRTSVIPFISITRVEFLAIRLLDKKKNLLLKFIKCSYKNIKGLNAVLPTYFG
jgi:hypothetical protein